jgi:hypothetical protein
MAFSANPGMNQSDRTLKRVMLMNGIFSPREKIIKSVGHPRKPSPSI